jgi:hypothetical protein
MTGTNKKYSSTHMLRMACCAMVCLLCVTFHVFAQTETKALSSMSVAEFLDKADIVTQSLIPPLTKEAGQIGEAMKQAKSLIIEKNAAATHDSKSTRQKSCPPEKGAWFKPEELLAQMKSIPLTEQNQSVTDTVDKWMQARYACPFNLTTMKMSEPPAK